jgi:flavin reductase (DIM6/NTAB) family NADH-FMN oxidoreductase RutF
MDADRFRQILGSFPTGVTVLSTAVDGQFHGITVNSLTSVSLEPPLVLVCVDRKAKAHAQMERAGRFGVSFLGVAQESLSRLFATSASPEPGRLRGVPYRIGSHGAPLIEGAIAWLECAVSDRWPGGDHTIFLASVLDGAVGHDGEPLVYFRSRYRRLSAGPAGGKQ